jgi:ABC-type branched-subunit amino acid transport system permease subunit
LLPQVSTSVPVIGSAHGRDVLFGAAVVVVMLLLPDGVAGLLARLRRLARA